MVEGRGFEPLKASPADLQSAPFGQLGNPSVCLKQHRLCYYSCACLSMRKFGAGGGTRIHNRSITSRVLYQLSYTGPRTFMSIPSSFPLVNAFRQRFSPVCSLTPATVVGQQPLALDQADRYTSTKQTGAPRKVGVRGIDDMAPHGAHLQQSPRPNRRRWGSLQIQARLATAPTLPQQAIRTGGRSVGYQGRPHAGTWTDLGNTADAVSGGIWPLQWRATI